MKQTIPGLSTTGQQSAGVPDGVYLVRVESVRFERARVKPFYLLGFSVIQPGAFNGGSMTGRLYATPKALWKLTWFLRDFAYDQDLLGNDEIDDKRLVGLHGVVKISHMTLNGRRYTSLDAFAHAEVWDETPGVATNGQSRQVAS